MMIITAWLGSVYSGLVVEHWQFLHFVAPTAPAAPYFPLMRRLRRRKLIILLFCGACGAALGCSSPEFPWGHRTVARAWRGNGAGVARAIGHCLACVARAWRGHGAGVARACPVTPGAATGLN
eukprot:gene23788-biopygen10387